MNTIIIILIVILILIFIYNKTYLENYDNIYPIRVIVFVSKSCGHCVNYNSNMHDKVVQYTRSNNINLERIFADEDKDNLFDKYNIQYVPALVIIKGNKVKSLDNSINPNSIDLAVKNM